MKWKARFLMIATALVLWGSAIEITAYADEAVAKMPTSNDSQLYRDVAGELRCPTCTGLSVLDSDAPFSVQIKNEVRTQIEAGKSKDDVLKFFVDRYGPWILRSPPVSGVNALAWLVPIALLILGPLFIWLVIGRKVRKASEEPVRSTAEIVVEMKQELALIRKVGGAAS